MLTVEDLKPLPDFISVEKFAELAEVSSRTVERWMCERKIDTLKLGGSIRIPKLELIRLLASGYRTRQM
jgi:excisionase family DNA binding protein